MANAAPNTTDLAASLLRVSYICVVSGRPAVLFTRDDIGCRALFTLSGALLFILHPDMRISITFRMHFAPPMARLQGNSTLNYRDLRPNQ